MWNKLSLTPVLEAHQTWNKPGNSWELLVTCGQERGSQQVLIRRLVSEQPPSVWKLDYSTQETLLLSVLIFNKATCLYSRAVNIHVLTHACKDVVFWTQNCSNTQQVSFKGLLSKKLISMKECWGPWLGQVRSVGYKDQQLSTAAWTVETHRNPLT